jgi:intracellular sulfur oxidation DsrE/DsrF family protein
MFSAPSAGFFRRGPAPASTGGRPSTGRRPATTVNTDDLAYFTTVSEKFKEITGVTAAAPVRPAAGALFGYGYYQYGIPSFTTPGWSPAVADGDSTASAGRSEGGRAAPGGRAGAASAGKGGADARLLKWFDAAGVDGFVAWTPVDHPTLGSVEVGGFHPYAATNPPISMLDELGPKHGAFVAYLASLYATVRIADVSVVDHGGGVFRIKAEIENSGFLPTSTAHGVTSRSVRPTMVQLGIDPDDLLSGADKTSFFQATDGSGGRRSFEWLVKGSRGAEIELVVRAQKGGSDSRRLRLQ